MEDKELLNQEQTREVPEVDKTLCISCGVCVSSCPANAIAFDDEGKTEINPSECLSCFSCVEMCAMDAIHRKELKEEEEQEAQETEE